MKSGATSYSRVREIVAELRPQAKVVAVTKYGSFEQIQWLYDQGCRDFAENRVENLVAKRSRADQMGLEGITWHFIGNIQSKKLPKIARYSDVVHSVTSLEQILKIESLIEGSGRDVQLYLQIKLQEDEMKGGMSLQEAACLITYLQKLWGTCQGILMSGEVSLRGMMVMPPLFDPKESHGRKAAIKTASTHESSMHESTCMGSCTGSCKAYQALVAGAHARCVLEEQGVHLLLSMGMSEDCGAALLLGSDLVRVGRILLPPR